MTDSNGVAIDPKVLSELGVSARTPMGASERAGSGKTPAWLPLGEAAAVINMSTTHTSDLGRTSEIVRRKGETGRWEYELASLHAWNARETAAKPKKKDRTPEKLPSVGETPEWLSRGPAAKFLGQSSERPAYFAQHGKVRTQKQADGSRLYSRDDLAAIRNFYAVGGRKRVLLDEIPDPRKKDKPVKIDRSKPPVRSTFERAEAVTTPPSPPPPEAPKTVYRDPKFQVWFHEGVSAGYLNPNVAFDVMIHYMRTTWGFRG